MKLTSPFPGVALIVITLAASLGAQTPQAPQTVPMSEEPFHRRVFENAFVAVYDVVLPVGATMKYHEHPTEHLALVIEPGSMKTDVLGQAPKDNPTGPTGTIVHLAAGPPHRQTNVGTTPVRFMAIELLGSPRVKAGVSGGGAAAATAAGRGDGLQRSAAPGQTKGCAVAIEGEAVRVWRCVVKAGTVAAARTGDGPFLRIAVSPGTIAAPGGGAADRATEVAAGVPAWLENAASTAVKNVGRAPFEFVDIAWK
jgi:quercetin dioxygenase-like cupin family protein